MSLIEHISMPRAASGNVGTQKPSKGGTNIHDLC